MNPTVHQVMVDYEAVLACCVWHAWWPGNDPFYLYNPLPVEQRVQYYGITWVPDLMLNGAGAGHPGGPDPGSYGSMASFIDSCLAVPSPVAISCTSEIEGDVQTVIDVTVESPLTGGDYRLFVALIEEHIDLPSPNGETDHYAVFRWSNAGNTAFGESIDLGDVGTTRYAYSFPIVEPDYQIDELGITAWIQEYASGEVVQAAKSSAPLPVTHLLAARHTGPGAVIGAADEVVRFTGELENRANHADRCDIDVSGVPAGWGYSYTTPAGTFTGPSELLLASGEVAPITLDLDSQGNPGTVTLVLSAASQSAPQVSATLELTKVNGLDVLLVDDDCGTERQAFIEDALASAGVTSFTWPRAEGELTGTDLASAARSVIWMCGVGTAEPTLTPGDRAALGAFLDGGGRAAVTGTDISFDLASPASSRYTPESRAWFESYMHAVHQSNQTFIFGVDGTPGDPIGDGLAPDLSTSGDNRQQSQDGIWAGPGADVVFAYRPSSPSGDAAVRWEDATTKVIFFAFGIEGIEPASIREAVVERIADWFGSTSGCDEAVVEIGSKVRPLIASPNPFRFSTVVAYDLGAAGPVALRVVDAGGHVVRALATGRLNAGEHTIVWDGRTDAGRPAASGVYFLRIDAETETRTARIVLLR